MPTWLELTNKRFMLGVQLTDAKFRVAFTFPHLMLFASQMVNFGTAMISGSLISVAILMTKVSHIYPLASNQQ